MLNKLLKKVVGTKNDRELARLAPLVDAVNEVEPRLRALSDGELVAMTNQFKEKLDGGADLDDILFEAFAVCREAAVRTLGLRPFDVQLIGGLVLHEGKIAEMRTGEGKTLAATLPAYLNALTGKGVHVVTVNDYLASRDAEWMGQVYRFLGLEVGCVLSNMDEATRRAAYGYDVTYGTNNEFGFDYLRDNMKFTLAEMVQREFNFAIVDEVDSILVDEARTPLIISGPTEKSTALYYQVDRIIPRLSKESDFTIDEKARSASLTEGGVARVEKLIKVENLYDPRHIELLHHVQQALKAHSLFQKDVDYIVKDNHVVIVDEFTGRLMPGRRWSDGLHQAIEAKERVNIENENQTLATITFQNYFRMYDKLAGMTGTADTEAVEFKEIYDLEVVVIPTHKEMIRKDNADQIYRTEREKFESAAREIEELHKKGQPVLVGTVSIEKSERLAGMLKKKGVPHTVLNAKHHAKEAHIIAQAGQPGAVTIATNMAGRGVDIVLGGNPEGLARQTLASAGPEAEIAAEEWEEALRQAQTACETDRRKVLEANGLHILGTERHESRRIDNQLRGRSGRQGDHGSSRFYLSLEDDLLRIFGSDKIKGLMGALGMEEGEPIEHGLLSKGIENAQRRVEGHNFDIRKQLLEFDDVMNKQRQVIYAQRRMVLEGEDLEETVLEMISDLLDGIIAAHFDPKAPQKNWDLKGLSDALFANFGLVRRLEAEEMVALGEGELKEQIDQALADIYRSQMETFGQELWRDLEKMVMLQAVDGQWKDHLLAMDHLKEGIGLRGYGQREPLKEYQREGFDMFGALLDRVRLETVNTLLRLRLSRPEQAQEALTPDKSPVFLSHTDEPEEKTIRRDKKKIGRNSPCPCGSGKKYKKCCGKKAA